jgi:hypothetical protein
MKGIARYESEINLPSILVIIQPLGVERLARDRNRNKNENGCENNCSRSQDAPRNPGAKSPSVENAKRPFPEIPYRYLHN